MLDLCKSEIVEYTAEKNKNGKLVEKIFYSLKYDLRKINLFHTDLGSELKNENIE